MNTMGASQKEKGRSFRPGASSITTLGNPMALNNRHPLLQVLYLGIGFLVLILVLFLIFFDWNYFKPTLARVISEKTGRPTVIGGNLSVHVWSWEPSAEVDGLTMKNPPWAEREVMFHADRLIVSVSLAAGSREQLTFIYGKSHRHRRNLF